eukprot:7176892-Prymnesium_polylepis.1
MGKRAREMDCRWTFRSCRALSRASDTHPAATDYVPGWMRAMGLRMFENLWPEIERELYETAMQQLGNQVPIRNQPK